MMLCLVNVCLIFDLMWDNSIGTTNIHVVVLQDQIKIEAKTRLQTSIQEDIQHSDQH